MKSTCACGSEFETTETRVKNGRGKFCSKQCKYKYRVMPKRGTGSYKLLKENPSWIKPGQRLSPQSEFKKGTKPHNFLESGYGYHTIHDWVSFRLGKASVCKHCGSDKGRIEWANISHEYKRDLSDWMSLCKKCHIKYDRQIGWGDATIKFSLPGKKSKSV
jgi:hypothetical protein